MFMDFYKDMTVSTEDVKNAHISDESVQSKYGVTYHQFWVNEFLCVDLINQNPYL